MKLKECPFCGALGFVQIELDPDEHDVNGKRARCFGGCDALGPLGLGDAGAIAAWNCRADGWVSVEERLPEPSWVLVYQDGAICCMAYTKKGWEDWNDSPHLNVDIERITYWQYIEPPE